MRRNKFDDEPEATGAQTTEDVPEAGPLKMEDVPPFDPKVHGRQEIPSEAAAVLGPAMVQALERSQTAGTGSHGNWVGEILKVHKNLAAMQKVQIYIPQTPPGKTDLPPIVVKINDYPYSVPRGVAVAVPLEIANIIFESGALNYPG